MRDSKMQLNSMKGVLIYKYQCLPTNFFVCYLFICKPELLGILLYTQMIDILYLFHIKYKI